MERRRAPLPREGAPLTAAAPREWTRRRKDNRGECRRTIHRSSRPPETGEEPGPGRGRRRWTPRRWGDGGRTWWRRARASSPPMRAHRRWPSGWPGSGRVDRGASPGVPPDAAVTPGISELVSGVILFDETVRQRTRRAPRSPRLLRRQGSSRGSRSTGAPSRSRASPDEVVTEGLDGLAAASRSTPPWERASQSGVRSSGSVTDTAHGHLHRGERPRAGTLCRPGPGGGLDAHRRAGGADGRHARSGALRGGHVETLRVVYEQLGRHGMVLEASLLKPNMILPGGGLRRTGERRRDRRVDDQGHA